jgi:hypothetical protein
MSINWCNGPGLYYQRVYDKCIIWFGTETKGEILWRLLSVTKLIFLLYGQPNIESQMKPPGSNNLLPGQDYHTRHRAMTDVCGALLELWLAKENWRNSEKSCFISTSLCNLYEVTRNLTGYSVKSESIIAWAISWPSVPVGQVPD